MADRTRRLLILIAVTAVVVAGLWYLSRTAGAVAAGIVAVAMPAWFSRPVARVVGGLWIGAIVFLFLRFPMADWLGHGRVALGGWSIPTAHLAAAFACLGLAVVAWWLVPFRVLQRFCFVVPSMVVLIYVVCLLMYLAPGSPFAQDKAATAQVLAAKRAAWGVPDNPTAFFGVYMRRVLEDFDFGPSLKVQGRSVMDLLGHALPVSIALGLLALCIAAGLGLVLGIRAGLRPNSIADHASMGLAVVGISVPNFVIGALLIILFALGLGWFPVAGWGSYGHLFLPAVTLGLPYAAYIARLARGGTIEVMQQDFIRTARAKGLPERSVVLKHALRGAILPVVSFLGPAAAGILTGSFVVEYLFSIPGMGQWFVKGAINRDYSVVLGTAIIYLSIVIGFNLLVDLAYAWLDPRVRESV